MKFKISRSTSNQIIAVFFAKSCHLTTTPLQKRKRVNAELYINICLPKVFEAWTARRPNKQSRSGELRTQKLKSHLPRTQSLKGSHFKARSRSVHSHICYAYCQGFLPCLFLPLRSIHLHFFSKTSPDFFPVLAVANTGSRVGLQNKIGHPAGYRFPC